MRTTEILASGLSPSVICLGTGAYGSSIPRGDAFRLLDTFAESGGTFIDTAHVYADWAPGGRGASERTIGSWLASRGVRDRMVLATKGAHPRLDTMDVSRLSRADIRQDLSESLERLGTDRIDLYWLHRDDPGHPVEDILEALNEARADGLIRSFGCSNWSPDRMRAARSVAQACGWTGFCASQVGWSLAAVQPGAFGTMRAMDAEALAYHRETGLAVAAYSSQANGFFSGRYGRNVPEPEGGSAAAVKRLYYSEANFRRLERATELAAEHHVSPNAVALAYLLHQPFPTFAIVGPHSQTQLRDSLSAAAFSLSAEEVASLEAA